MANKEWLVADAIYNAGQKQYDKAMRTVLRELNTYVRIGEHIENGNQSQARKVYENNRNWMTLPTSALNFLYPES